MDASNIPVPNSDFPQDSPQRLDSQYEINQKAAEIAAIVDRDRKRRKRTLYVLFGLLLITTALAGVVFALGRSDQQLATDMMNQTVDRKVNEVEKQLPNVVKTEVSSVVTTTVDDKIAADVTPKLSLIANQVAAIEAQPNSPPTVSLLSSVEVGQIKKAISVDLPQQAFALERLSGQLDEIAAVSNAVKGETWSKDKFEVINRLDLLEKDLAAGVEQLNTLSEKLEAVVKRLGSGAIDPCSSVSELESTTFRTYSVKEDTTSRLYDLDLAVKLENVKERTVRGLTVFRSDVVLLPEKNVLMGDPVSFQDNNFRYTLIPIFVNKRSLAKDFIGLAISRARRCPATQPK